MQPYPRAPDLVWRGHLHGTGCLSARAMDTGLPTVVWCLCFGPGCVWARVSSAPRHSWLGCWAVRVFVRALRLYPATPGCGVRCGCVCLGSGFGCAPPLLAGLLGLCVFVCPFRLYPATPGWGVWRGCVWLGSGFGCAPPLLAGVLGCMCVGVRASLVPRHSWLGCVVWVCVLGLRFRLRPATPGWGVWVCVCSCARSACTPPLLAGVFGVGVCLGSGFGCAPPLLAGVLACVCVCVPGPYVPRHSWLGCAAWVCVLGLGFGLCPATPGWGVGVCVCLCARFACTPPLLAGVLGCVYVCLGSGFGCAPPLLVGVLGCVCVRVLAPLVPRHSWLGCLVCVCVFGLGCRLRPATPGWGVGVCVWSCARSACTPPLLAGMFGCVCVCSGSWLGSAPPLLAAVLACVCVRVPAALVSRHCWLGCLVWVCVLGLGFRLRPATPGWGVGMCVCLCARSVCTPPLLAGVCGVGVCAWAWVWAVPRHSWLGCWGVCVFVCPLRLYPATPGWGVGLCVCVLGLGLWLRPATPGWGVGVCVCSCACSACSPPLLAGVFGVCVCVWARMSAAPRHSWLGCWGVCVVVCPLRLYPATPGWDVWVCVCVLGLVAGQRPATPGCGVGVCVCSCARCACFPPLLAWVCGVGVCAWARVSAAPRHSWPGCWGVCVFLCPLLLFPATPGWGVRRGCVCLGSGFGCTPPLLARVFGCVCVCVRALPVTRHSWLGSVVWVCVLGLGFWAAPRHSWLGCWGVCVFVCALRLYPATPGWGLWCGCACLGSGLGCAPPLLAGVLGCACVCVRALPVPRHSWLVCVLWVCELGLRFWLRPASPGWGIFCRCVFFLCALHLYPAAPGWGVWCGCVCLGSGFGCAPPLLAGVLGCLCVCVRAPHVPRHSWLGFVVWVCVLGLGFRLRPGTPGWSVGVCVCLCARSACTPPLLAGVCGVWVGCCPAPVPVPWFVACCARCPGFWHPVAVVAWDLSVCRGCGRWRASLACLVAPRWCARPRPVLVALGAPLGFPGTVVPFSIPGSCAPRLTGRLRGARGGRPRTGLFVPAAGPRRGRGSGLAPRPTCSGPRDGAVPDGSLRRQSSAACAAVVGVCGPGH